MVHFDNIIRIGEKLVSVDRVRRLLERVMELRAKGLSQQEVARRLSLDRSFISRLETIGEVRKGKRLAAIGFPVENKEELGSACQDLGVEFFWFMNNRERWELVGNRQALDFFNEVLELIARLRDYEVLVLATSKKWYQLAEALLDCQIIYIDLGPTPVREDRRVGLNRFRNLIVQVLKESGRKEQE
ncbi:MAG: helix-turn-helix transcriptional regulator [Firmicutes bacterium]|nr:helix-turn-helix transcriptional regulator [Bacillota bacterium]